MKNGSDCSAAERSTPADRQVSSRPLGSAREPDPTVRPSREATSSSRSVRTAHPSGRVTAPARGRDPASEGALLGLRLVDHREQLEIEPAERDDPVGGTPAKVTTAFEEGQPVQRFELAGG